MATLKKIIGDPQALFVIGNVFSFKKPSRPGSHISVFFGKISYNESNLFCMSISIKYISSSQKKWIVSGIISFEERANCNFDDFFKCWKKKLIMISF